MKGNPGIYCIIPIGELYDESIAKSVRWRLRRMLGIKIKHLENKELDEFIKLFLVNNLLNLTASEENPEYRAYAELGVWLHDNGEIHRLKKNAAERLKYVASDINSAFGFAVFHNGRMVHYELMDFSKAGASQQSEDSPFNSNVLIENFFRANKNKSQLKSVLQKKGWAIMLAVANYMAARLEATGIYPDNKYRGQSQNVLMDLAMKLSYLIRKMAGRNTYGRIQYGYILARKGHEGRILRVI